jgi:hypothetical protein
LGDAVRVPCVAGVPEEEGEVESEVVEDAGLEGDVCSAEGASVESLQPVAAATRATRTIGTRRASADFMERVSS